MEQFHLDDEKLKQSYQRILNRSCCAQSVGRELESPSSSSDSENECPCEPFQVELYVCSVQDKIRQLLSEGPVYLCFKYPKKQVGVPPVKTRIKSLQLELASNCCLMVSIDYTNIMIKSKKALSGCDISVYTVSPTTRQSSRLMQITNTVIGGYIDAHELVVHHEQQEKKTVSFTITSDLDISEGSLWFKVGYLDYSFTGDDT
jgi:hypothetical protein